ncbi:MAG: TonB-dependent receptor, partial [Candidatus Delongbacteria bacterium]|nr:TonB-dependent receptor [Candidatus Delongbacteria bacterium]
MRRVWLLGLIGWMLSIGSMTAATISGYVTEKQTGEPVPYANVIVVGKYVGAVTNHKGYFIITSLTPGNYTIMVDHISYHKKTETCVVKENGFPPILKIELESGEIEMQTIEVVDSVEKINTRSIQVGTIHQTTREIKQVPQILEADVFRAVQYLPGVSAISDFSSGLYVRGGSQDQNLILIDGIDVYNPTHFGGLFSTFNTDAVRDVELLKSGYPAKYGGRLSSVLSVSNKDGNRKEMDGVARISILSSSLTLESPWKVGNQKGSYMVSGRRTYLDIADKFVSADLPDYYFYDGHAKLNWDISDRDKLSFSTYLGKDQLKLDAGMKAKMMWGNSTFSTQWVHLFNPQFFSHFILAGSQYLSRMKFTVEDTYFDRKNIVNDLTLRGLLNFKPNEYHMLDFGFDLKQMNVVFKATTNDENADQTHMPDIDADNTNLSTYMQDSWDMTPVWTLQPGIRTTFNSSLSNLKSSSRSRNLHVEPRIALRRKLSVTSNVFVSYGRFYQYITSLNMGEVTPFDLWFPLDNSVDAGISNYFTAGYKTLLFQGVSLDVEGYYKNYE